MTLTLLPYRGGDELLSDEMGLLLVVGVDGDDLAGAEELGPGGGHEDVVVLLVGVGDHELDVIELVDVVLVLHFSVRKGGHASGTPVDGEVRLVDKTPVEQVHERELGDPPVVGGVRLVVDAGVHGLSEHLEVLGHLRDESVGVILAELPVLLPGGVELGDVVLLLDLDLDRGPVDVEAEGEEHVVALHPPVTSREIDQGVSRSVSQVQRSRSVPRRIVDAVHRLLGLGVEAIHRLVLPHVLPAFLDGS